MNFRILAIGQDPYWLAAVQQAAANLTHEPSGRQHRNNFVKCIADLPRSRPDTVLLLDASDQRNLVEAVAELRSQGWNYVVVVAADQSVRQATAILRQGLGFDYWIKTYDENKILDQVKTCFKEITEQKKRKDES
jgi:DNA-binding NtrC family response regulator